MAIDTKPGIYLNEHFSSDDDEPIFFRTANNEIIPLGEVDPIGQVRKFQDASIEESISAASSMNNELWNVKPSMEKLTQATEKNHTTEKHLNSVPPNTNTVALTATQKSCFMDTNRPKNNDPTVINERRQRLLLKANIRKLTRLTLENQSLSRKAIVRKFFEITRKLKLRFRRVVILVQPLKIFMHKTERKFGTGIASFFDLWISIIYLNLAIFLVTFILAIIPWFFSNTASNLSFLLDWRFIPGLFGIDSSVIGKSWFYYGGYASIEEENRRWNTPFAYALSVLGYYGVSLIIVVLAIGARLATVTSTDPNVKYSTAVLSMWDHQVTSKYSVEALQRSVASKLKEYLKEDELKSSGKKVRTKKQFFYLIIRRLIGYTTSLVLIISAPLLVFIITQFYKNINSTIPFTTSFLIAILSFVYPKLLQLSVKIEGYENATYATLHNVIRTFIVKLSIATSLVIRVLYPTVLNLELGSTSTEEVCIGTEAGMVFWQLLIIDFFSSAISNIVPNLFMVRLKAIVGVHDRKLEFNIPDSVNQLLYRQALIWIGTALCPMLPVLGTLNNILLFLIKYFICRWTIKFPKNPMANAKSNSFNQFMLLITLILSLIPSVSFLLKNDHTCGPFYRTNGAEIISTFFSTNRFLTAIPFWYAFWTAVRSPLILYICLIVLFIILFFAFQRLRMYKSRWRLELQRVQLERTEKQDLQKIAKSKPEVAEQDKI